jgi:2-oxoglutarate ferredoxin oxidoreductase subunit alpha
MAGDLIIGMAGSGGDGIVSAGEWLTSACAGEGYHAMMTKSYGPQIRGGESSCRVRLGVDPVLGPGGALDVAIALNWEDWLKFGAELHICKTTVVIYDTASRLEPDQLPVGEAQPIDVRPVPIADLARKSAGTDRAKNSVVLGLLSGWFDINAESLLQQVVNKFEKKSEALVEANRKAFQAGLDYAQANPADADRRIDAPAARTPKLLADGNSMCAAAAIFAGCDFFGGYPITPSTEIMQLLTREIWKYGGAVLQCEDEIASIGAAVGASYGGKKAMTATSGPGMSLKTEILGLATTAELPLVVVNVQRGGPSTGMPTKTEQADLFQAAFSAHGDVVRPILAPTCVSDTFDVTVEAFNMAEHYQTPVIVLSDQEIAQRKEVIDPIDTDRFKLVERLRPTPAELENYDRFRITENGISPISEPGMEGGAYLGAGIEHDEHGSPTASGAIHVQMTEKRIRKLDSLRDRHDLYHIEGEPDAPLALIAWGSTAGVCREAMIRANREGLKTKLLVPILLYPINEQVYLDFFAGVESGLVVELSQQGQLYRLLRMFVNVPDRIVSMARPGGNPFRPAELVDALEMRSTLLQERPGEARPAQG